jgi:hypothetical protein
MQPREEKMKKRSQVLLTFYLNFRGTRPTVLQAFARQPVLYWAANSLLILIAGTYYYFARDRFSLVLLGAMVGALTRDIGWMLRFRRDWPTLDRVLDWQLVEQELASKASAES